jgi:hypothetical protein
LQIAFQVRVPTMARKRKVRQAQARIQSLQSCSYYNSARKKGKNCHLKK